MAGKLKIFLVMASLAAVAVAAPSVQAGVLVTTAESCDTQQFSQPFSQWNDSANYTPVPGGSFEAGQKAWALTGGAKVVSGNEGYYVRSRSDSQSLYLPAGASATTPAMCVGLAEPTLRYLSKSQSLLGLTGAMSVEVLTETSLGLVVPVPLVPGLLANSWTPGLLPTPIVANLLPLLGPGKTAVAFRFRALTGNWWLDDVYVDPYAKR